MKRIPVEIVRVKKLFPNWVGARVSNRTIYVIEGLRLTEPYLAHELRHVQQRDRLGFWFLGAYLLGWVRVGFRYKHIPLEREARAAEKDPVMLAWAYDLLRGEP